MQRHLSGLVVDAAERNTVDLNVLDHLARVRVDLVVVLVRISMSLFLFVSLLPLLFFLQLGRVRMKVGSALNHTFLENRLSHLEDDILVLRSIRASVSGSLRRGLLDSYCRLLILDRRSSHCLLRFDNCYCLGS